MLSVNIEQEDNFEVAINGGYIYLISNKINGKQYVGQTINSIKQRWSQHICNSKRGKKYPLYNAINKYGVDSFEVSIIAKVNSIDALNILERFFINEFKTIVPNGYNIREGGNNGRLNESTRRKLSLRHKGKPGYPHTEEFKKKLAKRSVGNKYALGRKQPIEERKKHKIISKKYYRNNKGIFIKKNE